MTERLIAHYVIGPRRVLVTPPGRGQSHEGGSAMQDATQLVAAETWRPTHIKNWYEVSDQGRIRNARTGRILRIHGPYRNHPYPSVHLGAHTPVSVHVVVCQAFHGPRPTPRHEVAHNNGIHQDNRAENVRWATHSENCLDRREHGTAHLVGVFPGEASSQAKLNGEQVIAMRRTYAAGGASQHQLARQYGVSRSLIARIVQGKNWRHLL